MAELLGDAPEGRVPPQSIIKLQRLNIYHGQRIARAKVRLQEQLTSVGICRQVQVAELLGDAPQGWVPPQSVIKLQRLNMHRGQRIARAKVRAQEQRELEAEFAEDNVTNAAASLQMQPSSRWRPSVVTCLVCCVSIVE